MIKNELGATGIKVSPLGLGTVKFGRNEQVKYPSSFVIPSDKEVQELLAYAKDLSINVLDTAPAYGNSEQRLGKLLVDRKEWVIVDKVGEEFVNGESQYDFTPEHIRMSVDRSLQRLNTDYIDVMLVHSNGDDINIIENHGVFDTLAELKQQGKILSFGMSTKTVEGGLATVAQADVVMVTYNPIETKERPVIQAAHENNKGVFIKKALASGHLNKIEGEDPVKQAMDFIFETPGVSSVIVGTINKDHLKHNVECLKSGS